MTTETRSPQQEPILGANLGSFLPHIMRGQVEVTTGALREKGFTFVSCCLLEILLIRKQAKSTLSYLFGM